MTILLKVITKNLMFCGYPVSFRFSNRLDQILGKHGSKKTDAYDSKVCLASRIVKVERQVRMFEMQIVEKDTLECTYARIHRCTHTRTHTQTHTRTRTHARTHARTHTHTLIRYSDLASLTAEWTSYFRKYS